MFPEAKTAYEFVLENLIQTGQLNLDEEKLAYLNGPWVFGRPCYINDTDLPMWVRRSLRWDRLWALAAVPGEASDLEALVFLYSAMDMQPLKTDYLTIFRWLGARLNPRRDGEALPDDLQQVLEEGLSEYHQGLLRDLKQRIYAAVIKHHRKARKSRCQKTLATSNAI